jgi:hypothetical protein
MDKKELIDCICEINKSAKTDFLTQFSEEDLNAYLESLIELEPRFRGNKLATAKTREMVVCS